MRPSSNPTTILSMPRAELDALSNLNPTQRKTALNLLRRYYSWIYHPDQTGLGSGQLADANRAIDAMLSSFSKQHLEAPGDGDNQLQRLRDDNSYLRDRLEREHSEMEKLKGQISVFQSPPARVVRNTDYKELWQETDERRRQLYIKQSHQRREYHHLTNTWMGIVVNFLTGTTQAQDTYAGAVFRIGKKTRLWVEPDGQVACHIHNLPVRKRGRLLGFISVPEKFAGNSYSLHPSDLLIEILTILGKGMRQEFLPNDHIVSCDGSKLKISGIIKRVQM